METVDLIQALDQMASLARDRAEPGEGGFRRLAEACTSLRDALTRDTPGAATSSQEVVRAEDAQLRQRFDRLRGTLAAKPGRADEAWAAATASEVEDVLDRL